MIQHIGNDFTSGVRLNLLPGIKLRKSFYRIDMQYVTDTAGNLSMHSMSSMDDGSLVMKFGRDVLEFKIVIHNLNSAEQYAYSMRVDHLILLNLAHQLLN